MVPRNNSNLEPKKRGRPQDVPLVGKTLQDAALMTGESTRECCNNPGREPLTGRTRERPRVIDTKLYPKNELSHDERLQHL